MPSPPKFSHLKDGREGTRSYPGSFSISQGKGSDVRCREEEAGFQGPRLRALNCSRPESGAASQSTVHAASSWLLGHSIDEEIETKNPTPNSDSLHCPTLKTSTWAPCPRQSLPPILLWVREVKFPEWFLKSQAPASYCSWHLALSLLPSTVHSSAVTSWQGSGSYITWPCFRSQTRQVGSVLLGSALLTWDSWGIQPRWSLPAT